MTSELKEIFLFRGLSNENFDELKTIVKFKSYAKGETLFYEGTPAKKLYILVDGILKAYKTDMKENEIVLHYFYPASLIAEVANFQNIAFPATTEFQTPGRVLEIEYDKFEEKFLKNPLISFEIIKSLTLKIRYIEDIITTRLSLDATARVARFIYYSELEEKIKQYEIANILGLTPETLSRSLKKIKNLGLISAEGTNFTILNKNGLKELFS